MTFPEVLGIIPKISINKIGGTNQTISAYSLLPRKVMEHQNALAKAIRAYFKA
jgi:hypothetical protein